MDSSERGGVLRKPASLLKHWDWYYIYRVYLHLMLCTFSLCFILLYPYFYFDVTRQPLKMGKRQKC
ncbi:unnamed protein product [Ixodes pacificus]